MGRKFKRVLCISDMHTLSNVGIMTDGYYMDEGNKDVKRFIPPNNIQKIYYKEWLDMCKKMGKVDILINVGDSAEGKNPKGSGYGVVDSNVKAQVVEANRLIQKIDFKMYGGVNGSKYHVGNNQSADEYLAELCDSSRHPATFGTDLMFDVNGVKIHVSHKVGASSTINRVTSINKEVMMACLNNPAYGDVDIVIRGHTHYFSSTGVYYKDKIRHGIIVPCWKARDEFSRSGSLAWCPVNGYVWIDVYDDGTYIINQHLFQVKGEMLFQTVKV